MSLKSFSLKMFQHCPLFSAFSPDDHLRAFQQFMEYKTRVPVRGAILLNPAMDSALLVKGYKKGASWSFPRGKINKDEPDLDCAVREVYEETGFDLQQAGLVERNSPVDYIEVTLKDQQVRLFIFRDVLQDTIFEPKTRKEIGDIQWYKLTDLPAYRKKKVAGKGQGNGSGSNDKFYMVAPFMVPLRQWILRQRKMDPRVPANGSRAVHPAVPEEDLTEDNVADRPAAKPAAVPDASAEYVDRATKELRDALLGPLSAGQSKDSPAGLHPDAGQAILGLLRNAGTSENKPAQTTVERNRGGDYRRPHEPPITPLDHISMEAPHPNTPHHHHPTQRVPFSSYDRPPQFPISPNASANTNTNTNTNITYSQNRQTRPEIQMTTDARGMPSIEVATKYYQDKPVQLLHPQPLPPQVQGDKLIQSMMSSSMVPNPNMRGPPPNGATQNHQTGQHQQGHGLQGAAPAPNQLPAHSLNLLSALKGESTRATTTAFQTSNAQPNFTALSAPYQQAHHTMAENGSAIQDGSQARPLQNPLAGPKQSTTEQHRSALLDMFKKSEPSLPQGQFDSQGSKMSSPRQARPNEIGSRNQSPSTAEVLRNAARDKNGPIAMNPETNLPFGALSILSRPQSGKTVNNSNSPRQRSDANTGQRQTPSSPLARSSPGYNASRGKVPDARGQWPPQARPSLAQAYPYGPAQGATNNSFSVLPSPPAASTFPVPGVLKPRQDSSSEHKNTLLSLFGKQISGIDQGKGKEPAVAAAAATATTGDPFASGTAAGARMASVSSSRGDASGSANNPTSRRGSQTPLSPAERNFLLGFLETQARQ